jgi:hypothetical protein
MRQKRVREVGEPGPDCPRARRRPARTSAMGGVSSSSQPARAALGAVLMAAIVASHSMVQFQRTPSWERTRSLLRSESPGSHMLANRNSAGHAIAFCGSTLQVSPGRGARSSLLGSASAAWRRSQVHGVVRISRPFSGCVGRAFIGYSFAKRPTSALEIEVGFFSS